MSLSDRRTIINSLPEHAIYNEKDVKESIKDLKEKTEVGSVENKKIPKLNWVADGGDVEVRVLMPNGNWVSGVAEDGIKKLKVGSIIQFERFGFCRFDGINKGLYEFWFGHK